MADQWHYAKGSEKHGPVSSSELRRLARDGDLQPTDLVHKDGMADWAPASRVKGLFDKSSRTAPPPLPPNPPNASHDESPHTPDLGEAAKGLFSAATAKAKELGTKATDAAKQYQDKLQEQLDAAATQSVKPTEDESETVKPDSDTASSSPTGKPSPKWAMWTAGGGCFALVSICLFCGLLGAILKHFEISGTSTTNGYTSKDGTSGYVMAATDLPTPVSQAVADRKEVWQLLGYKEGNDDRTLYIILGDGTLENLVPVERQSKGVATMYHGERNAPDQDVFGWRLHEPNYNNEGSTGKVRIEWQWILTRSGNNWTLTKSQRTQTTPQFTTTETQIDITIDEDVGEGF